MDQLARVRGLGGPGEQAIGARDLPNQLVCRCSGNAPATLNESSRALDAQAVGVAEVLMLTRVAECDPHRRVRKGLIECVLRARPRSRPACRARPSKRHQASRRGRRATDAERPRAAAARGGGSCSIARPSRARSDAGPSSVSASRHGRGTASHGDACAVSSSSSASRAQDAAASSVPAAATRLRDKAASRSSTCVRAAGAPARRGGTSRCRSPPRCAPPRRSRTP